MRRWTWIAAVAAMAASFLPPPVAAQTSDAVGIVTTIDGRATVARPALPSPLAIKFKDDVFGRDRISTQENSLVRVLLGGKAILTVRELSQVTISEEPGRAVVTLPDGKVVLAVDKKRMRPGESIEIRTPNAVAAVRGSVLAVGFDSALGVTTAFCGAGSCTVQQGTGPSVPLPVGLISINGQQRPATPAEADTLVNVQTTGRAVTSPVQTTTALIQAHTNQATQVAQFVSTGTVCRSRSPTRSRLRRPRAMRHPSTRPARSRFRTGKIPGAPPTAGTGGGTTPPPPPPPGGGPKTNVLVNPGFESGLTGWTLSGGGGIVSSFGSITRARGPEHGPDPHRPGRALGPRQPAVPVPARKRHRGRAGVPGVQRRRGQPLHGPGQLQLHHQ